MTMCAFGAFCCTLATLLIALLCFGSKALANSGGKTNHNACRTCRMHSFVRSFGALLVPDVSLEFYRAQVTYLDGAPFFLAGLVSTGRIRYE